MLLERVQTLLEKIIAILLKNFVKLTDDLKQLHNAIPALKLLEKMLPHIGKNKRQELTSQQSSAKQSNSNILVESIADFNDFYQRMSKELQKVTRMRRNAPELETYKQASEILVEI